MTFSEGTSNRTIRTKCKNGPDCQFVQTDASNPSALWMGNRERFTMILLEHDAKELLAEGGIPIPAGFLAVTSDVAPPAGLTGPWMVKAQVPVGGRGKAGGIRRAETAAELRQALDRVLGMTIKGQTVHSRRVEQAVQGIE